MSFALDNLIELLAVAAIVVVGAVALGIVARVALWLVEKGYALWERDQQNRLHWAQQRVEAQFVTVRPGEIRLAPSELIEAAPAQFRLALAQVATMQPVANVPHTLTYSPHVHQIEAPAKLEAERIGVDSYAVPSFSQLHQQGIISPDRLLCGYQDNQPYYGTLRDVFSTLIIAKSGGGKTTLERCLVGQAVNMGAKVGVIDPHGHSSQGLASALAPLMAYQLFEPAIDDKPIEQAIHYFMHLVDDRLHSQEPPGGWPVRILAVDELNMLIDDLGNKFAFDLTRLAERGRKVGVFVFAAGQSAEMSRTGGDARLRKAFVGRYVLRTDKDAAQRLIPDKDLLATVPLLAPGQAIFVPTRAEPVPLTIPNTTEADLRICFPSQVVEPVPVPVIEPVPALAWQVAPEPATPQAARVKQLLKMDRTYTEIIAEVWGITQKGRAWQEASNELRQIVCSLIPD